MTSSLVALAALSVLLTGVTIVMVRRWNPSRSVFVQTEDEASDQTQRAKTRTVWDSPLIWREMRTLAYGRKIIVIKLAYLVIAAAAVALVAGSTSTGPAVLGMISVRGFAFVALALLGAMLVNAQAVTAVTSERDGQTLELLLVTDVSAKEFVFSKLGGVFYNTKEVLIVPLLLVGWYIAQGTVTLEEGVYVILGYLGVSAFSAMLGIAFGVVL